MTANTKDDTGQHGAHPTIRIETLPIAFPDSQRVAGPVGNIPHAPGAISAKQAGLNIAPGCIPAEISTCIVDTDVVGSSQRGRWRAIELTSCVGNRPVVRWAPEHRQNPLHRLQTDGVLDRKLQTHRAHADPGMQRLLLEVRENERAPRPVSIQNLVITITVDLDET